MNSLEKTMKRQQTTQVKTSSKTVVKAKRTQHRVAQQHKQLLNQISLHQKQQQQQQQHQNQRQNKRHKRKNPGALSLLIDQADPYRIDERQERKIFFVSTIQDWNRCEPHLRQAKIVGIDSETKPVFVKNRPSNPCSLLQLAVRNSNCQERVFVLDLLHLQPKVYNATLAWLFLSKDVVKLGQGLLQDLKELTRSYPKATCFAVAKQVVEVNDLSIASAGPHLPLSLQKLVFLYLQHKLTKTQQRSNWNRRPLTNSQLHYAAADALVLIHLFDVLMLKLGEVDNGFKLAHVTQVLDVHVVSSKSESKCSFCLHQLDSQKDLLVHRKECLKQLHSVQVCSHCDVIQLLSPVGMQRHVQQCQQLQQLHLQSELSVASPIDDTTATEEDDGEDTDETLEEESFEESLEEDDDDDDDDEEEEEDDQEPRPKRLKTSFKCRPRCFSTEEARLLAADDIWQQISLDFQATSSD